MKKLSEMEVGDFFPVQGCETQEHRAVEYWRIGLKVGESLWIYIHDELLFETLGRAEARCEVMNRKGRPPKTVYKVNYTCLIEGNPDLTCYKDTQVVADDIRQAVEVMKAWARQEEIKELDILAVWYSHEVKE